MKNEKSLKIYEEATKYIPGGVNSPVRDFKSVGLDPIFIERAHGSRIYDVDGNEYIDYICSWGPLMLGHSPKEIVEGIEEVVYRGTSYGVPTAIEVEMAKLVVEAYPAIDQVRMVNSGTEATMSALRVARAYTNRNKILKFEGCYHGHSDASHGRAHGHAHASGRSGLQRAGGGADRARPGRGRAEKPGRGHGRPSGETRRSGGTERCALTSAGTRLR